MSKRKYAEQVQRFEEVLKAKDKYFVDCEKCPIRNKCFEESEKLTLEESENAPICEELLLHYILTGDFLPLV